MFRGEPWLAVLCAFLAGCPDATQGKSPGELGGDHEPTVPDGSQSSGAPGQGGTSSSGAVEAGATHTRQTLAAVSGTLALGPTQIYVATAAGMMRVAKTGGSPVSTLSGMATWMQATAGHLYAVRTPPYTSFTEAALDGASPRTLTTDGDLIDGRAGLGTEDGHLQWVSASSSRVWSTDLATGARSQIREGDLGAPVAYLAVTARDLIYGVQRCGGCSAPESRSFTMVRRALSGGAESTLAEATDALSLRADARAAVWLEKGTGIRGVTLDGSSSPRAITGAADLFDSGTLAIDDTHAYWINRASGRVYRAHRDGGTPEIFAEGFRFADETEHQVGLSRDNGQRLVLDDAAAYVSDRDGLYRVTK